MHFKQEVGQHAFTKPVRRRDLCWNVWKKKNQHFWIERERLAGARGVKITKQRAFASGCL